MGVTDRLTTKLPGRITERMDRPGVVPVVRLHGVITAQPMPAGRGISLHGVDTALTKAFDNERLVAVALSINSPGGAATQSALIADRIRDLADRKGVPVLAFCEDVAASGGYWLACAGDEIYAHATSMVGSVGVISSGFGFTEAIDKLGIERRMHTAGESKSRLDPFRAERSEDVEWLRGMQDDIHEQFQQWVTQRRGSALSTEEKLFTGDVWTGRHAERLGLVDGLGTLHQVVRRRYGDDVEVTTVDPKKPLLARLGVAPAARSLGAAPAVDARQGGALTEMAHGVIDAAETKAHWSRYGL